MVGATTRVASTMAGTMAMLAVVGFAQNVLPQVPFSGSYGATMGAGSAVGWERDGNPAVLQPGGMGASLAGYSPFGLDGLSVLEAGVYADGRRIGTSLSHLRTEVQDAVSASAWRWQCAMRILRGWTGGMALRIQEEGGWNFGKTAGGSAAAGIIWSRYPAFSAGISAEEGLPVGRVRRLSLGADAGWGKGSASVWRLCGEGHFDSGEGGWKWRFGTALRLRDAISVNGGWSPAASTFALGLRFGMGRWQGYHSMRRHAFLGMTSVQGIRWSRPLPHPTPE